jgi:hypothetical protein
MPVIALDRFPGAVLVAALEIPVDVAAHAARVLDEEEKKQPWPSSAVEGDE